MTDAGETVLRGRVVFPDGDWSGAAASLVVRVEDASRADAAAVTVAEQVQAGVRLPGGDASVPFELRVPAALVGPRGPCSVRVHVDVSGTGTVTAGDFVSTESYPLNRTDLVIRVRRV